MGTLYKKPTQQEWCQKIAPILNPQIWIAGFYEHSQKPVLVGCYDCNRIFPMQVRSIQARKGCRQCNHRNYFNQVKANNLQSKKDRAARNEKKIKHCMFPPKPHWLNTEKHWHHIIPKHRGGTDDPSNLKQVSIYEHAQEHLELYKKYGSPGDLAAYQALMGRLNLACGGVMRGDANPMKDPVHKAYHAKRMKELAGVTAVRGDRNGNRKKKLAGFDFSWSQEQKTAHSAVLKGIPKPETMKEKLRARTGAKHHLSHSIEINGITYGSGREAERELGWGSGTCAYRLKNNPTKWNMRLV